MYYCIDCGLDFPDGPDVEMALARGCPQCGSDQLHPCTEWEPDDRAELPAPVPAAGADEPYYAYLARQAARMAGPEEDDADGEDDGGLWAEYRHRYGKGGA